MPLTAAQKKDLVQRYEEGIASAQHLFLIEFRGISVPQVTELRDRVRESGGQYLVVKNRLALRAISGHVLESLKEHFQGPTAVAWSEDDPVSLAKALTDFAKSAPVIEFKAGVVDGAVISADQVEAIAALPTRDELISKLVFLLQSPVTRLVRTLAALPRDFVVVLGQVAHGKNQG
jgi:large subunit ribosomal protein L10